MDNEDYVRNSWSKIKKWWKDNDSYGDDVFHVEIGGKDFYDTSTEPVWKEAAKFTKDRLKEIEEAEDEINWLISESSMSDGFPYPPAKRLLNRSENRLKNLREGLKINV